MSAAKRVGDAAESCPDFPGKTVRPHWGLEDPARVEGNETQRLEVFRRVRLGLKQRIESFLTEIPA